MKNVEKYNQVFIEVLDITAEKLEGLSYKELKQWDSIGHMSLIAELEDAFDIEIETDDIIDFSSYEKGKEILAKYGVAF